MFQETRIILILATLSLPSLTFGDNASISKAWKERAKEATENLTQSKLDDCDTAVEKAFQTAVIKQGNGQTIYEMNLQIGKQSMQAAYSYTGNSLSDFLLISLPPRWMAHQSPNSQVFSVVVVDSNCAFDLCINNPLSKSSCETR